MATWERVISLRKKMDGEGELAIINLDHVLSVHAAAYYDSANEKHLADLVVQIDFVGGQYMYVKIAMKDVLRLFSNNCGEKLRLHCG